MQRLEKNTGSLNRGSWPYIHIRSIFRRRFALSNKWQHWQGASMHMTVARLGLSLLLISISKMATLLLSFLLFIVAYYFPCFFFSLWLFSRFFSTCVSKWATRHVLVLFVVAQHKRARTRVSANVTFVGLFFVFIYRFFSAFFAISQSVDEANQVLLLRNWPVFFFPLLLSPFFGFNLDCDTISSNVINLVM